VCCILSPAECFHKRIVAHSPDLAITERANGWWSMRCPIGRHGPPLRLRPGDHVHISYTDLGKCPESGLYAWFIKQGVPAECLKKPKDWPAIERSREFGDMDGKLADSIVKVAFGEGTTTERLVRAVVLALGGEIPEGPICDVLADRLGIRPRTIYKATEVLRRRNRSY
jgi:hypothetical protein